MPSYRYPLEDSDSITGRVLFSAIATGNPAPIGTVELYAPPNLRIADSAKYGTIDLGTIGAAAHKAFESEVNKGGSTSVIDQILSGITGMDTVLRNSLGNSDLTGDAAQYYALTKLKMIPDNISKHIMYGAKRVVNPHTTTTFDSVDIRSFSFNFTLIAESSQESEMIKNIDDFFRTYLYPTLSPGGFFQNFPPIWMIQFLYGPSGSANINRFIPKIHDCFLTGYSSSYNSDYNSYHKDGAPISIDCELSFTETKPYDQLTILVGNTGE